MVALIREVVNIQISNSSASFQHFSITYLSSDMNMDDIRERSLLSSKLGSRDISIFSTMSLKAYYESIEINNSLLDDNIQESIDSSQLSYKEYLNNKILVNKATNSSNTVTPQHVSYESSALNTIYRPYGRTLFINNSNNILQETFNI